MSKSSVKHMSADGEDKFEEKIEGQNFGSIDDWETELGLKILKIQEKVKGADLAKDGAVIRMLERKLVTYKTALEFLDENAKTALIIGSEGGVPGIIAYLSKQAKEDAAKFETKKYSDKLMVELPGYKMWRESAQGRAGGIVSSGRSAAQGSAASNSSVG